MKKGFECVICGQWKQGYGSNNHLGNDPYPISDKGECCDSCNSIVISERIKLSKNGGNK